MKTGSVSLKAQNYTMHAAKKNNKLSQGQTKKSF